MKYKIDSLVEKIRVCRGSVLILMCEVSEALMILLALFTMCCRVFLLEAVETPDHTVMQPVKMLSTVPLSKEHMMGLALGLSSVWRGSRRVEM